MDIKCPYCQGNLKHTTAEESCGISNTVFGIEVWSDCGSEVWGGASRYKCDDCGKSVFLEDEELLP